jgi:hypothetical protein
MSQRSSTKKTDLATAPRGTPATCPATAPAGAPLADAVHEALELAELTHRIQEALNAAAHATPSDVRRLCMAVEADLLRASIRLVNARAMVASAGNAAHVAELAAMACELNK